MADFLDKILARRALLQTPEVQEVQRKLQVEEEMRQRLRDDPTSWVPLKDRVQLRESVLRANIPNLHPEIVEARNFYMWVMNQDFTGAILQAVERLRPMYFCDNADRNFQKLRAAGFNVQVQQLGDDQRLRHYLNYHSTANFHFNHFKNVQDFNRAFFENQDTSFIMSEGAMRVCAETTRTGRDFTRS